MKRWCSTNASASGPANSCSPARNTRSHGTKTSSKTVVVSIILCRALIGCSTASTLRGRRIVGRCQQHQPGRVDRDREADGVVAVGLGHRPRRQHDELVGVRADRGMRLRAANDDAVAPPLDDAHVEVGVGLCGRPERRGRPSRRSARPPRPGRCRRQCLVEAPRPGPAYAVPWSCIDARRDPEQREERVGANLLDQHDERLAGRRRQLDERAALQQVVAGAWKLVVAGVLAGSPSRHDAQLAMPRDPRPGGSRWRRGARPRRSPGAW